MNNLTLRIRSAAALAPVVLGAVYAGGIWFQGLILLAATLMVVEWQKLCKINNIYSLLVTLFFVHACLILTIYKELIPLLIVLAIGAAGVLSQRITRKDGRGWAVSGFLYVVIPCASLLYIREIPGSSGGDGQMLMFWLLAVVWATDIGAYFAGKTIGGPKLMPSISPKKTWAGLIGGMVAATLAGWGLETWSDQLNGNIFIWSGPILTVIAQAGDFFESWVKRRFDAKDSGTMIPGHGGILDRVDGILSTAPVMALVVLILELV